MEIELLADAFCEHAAFFRGRSKNTILGYRRAIRLYARISKVQTIGEVSDENVQAFFLHGRTKRNWKASSYIYYHKNLLVFFRWCVEKGYMDHNPIERIETPRLEKQLPKKLTRQQANRILETVKHFPYQDSFLRDRDYAIFSLFIFAGLRKSELLHLKTADIDIENQTIFVRQGKGAKDRIVPMSFTLAQSLKNYLKARNQCRKTCPEFFASLQGNRGFTQYGLKWLVEKMVEASGIRFNIHKLRHTFATLMLEGGCDIYSLSKMMGHSDIKTTTIYLSATAEHLRSQVMKHPLNTFSEAGR